MKILKKVFYSIIGFILFILLIALFLPSQYYISRSIQINRPVESIFTEVADFNNWLKWNPWSESDPFAKNRITVLPGITGSMWEWEGNVIGKGVLKINKIEKNKSITFNLQFLGPQKMESIEIWTFEPIDSGTIVTWSDEGKLDYPIGRYFGLFLDKMMGPDFEKGLNNLKRRAEEKQVFKE
jgi:hypothetical protein